MAPQIETLTAVTLQRTFHRGESSMGANLHLNEVNTDQQPTDSQPFHSDYSKYHCPQYAAHARPTLRQQSGCYETDICQEFCRP